RVFRRRAEELHEALQTRLQDAGQQFQLQLQLNALGPPRRGAFELSFAIQPTTVVSEQRPLWSGLKRTPRAQKFPDPDAMYHQIIEAYEELAKHKTNKRKRESNTSPSSSPSTAPSTSTSVKRRKKEK
ncbi:selenoprotein BthD-like, partial [Drosophila sulfurigaster albostrigata]|uniref:selenoprotein BthD-like n=1 Tax=Drosophila sulfurigaster albostrigata TaxID=89887 RepID=UPI002D21A8F6